MSHRDNGDTSNKEITMTIVFVLLFPALGFLGAGLFIRALSLFERRYYSSSEVEQELQGILTHEQSSHVEGRERVVQPPTN